MQLDVMSTRLLDVNERVTAEVDKAGGWVGGGGVSHTTILG